MNKILIVQLLIIMFRFTAFSQDVTVQPNSTAKQDSVSPVERYSYHVQLTTIQQHQFQFSDPYSGKNSLASHESPRLSVTSTLFAGRRLWKGAEVYINPELSGGRGLSGSTGIAGFSNGETYRIGSAEPIITVARLFLRQTFNYIKDTDRVESGQNLMKGTTSNNRLVITVGKFSITDMFDANTYSHDPRSQFFNWSIMSAGAWDYPANTRGYTEGIVVERIKPTWAIRVASVLVPAHANGSAMDVNVSRAHSETLEFDKQYFLYHKPGVIRFIVYNTMAHMGNYKLSLNMKPINPDIIATEAYGRKKTGFVINSEQVLSNNSGIFSRYSFNDGKNETWAFTEIDRSFQVGVSAKGKSWKRPNDIFGAAIVINGLSKDHKNYIAAGGYGFIIGDSRLNYRPESILELYYNIRFTSILWISPDYQFVKNPAYNKDRGPVNIVGVRGHLEF